MQNVLLQEYGGTVVKLSSANTYSHGSTHIKLHEYIDSFSRNIEDAPSARANESFYLFGPHAALSPRLSQLVEKYSPPPFAGSELAFSFGIGAHATGIPFHVHGHGFSEVIHGSKVSSARLFPTCLGMSVLPASSYMHAQCAADARTQAVLHGDVARSAGSPTLLSVPGHHFIPWLPF